MRHLHTILLGLAMASASPSAYAHESATDLVINEVCAANVDQWVDPSFNYGGWIELYNPTSSNVSLTGWYISDDPQDLRKFKISKYTVVKPGEYYMLAFDHYHDWWSPNMIDLKLDTEGGTIYLSNGIGIQKLAINYPAAISRCSWARTNDGGEEWSYCATPTPGKSNDNAKYAMERLDPPVIDAESRVFTGGSATLRVTIPDGCTLRYTNDGSTPTWDHGNTSTTGVFTTTSSRTYRFCLVREGYLPSEVINRTLIRSTVNIDLPILSIVGTQANFYGDSLGIFTQGRNGRPGNGANYKCNWNMDWERPAVFDYFASNGKLLFSQEVGLERCGGWSRAWSPFSFKIKAGKVYEGRNSLDYPFFDQKPNLKHKTLQIRNGGNDNGCRVKDPIIQSIVGSSGLNIDYQAYQPVAHFVNGTWKGTINMREPNNKDYVYANYGLKDEEIDQFEMSPDSGYVQKFGTDEAMQHLLSLSESAASDDAYETLAQLIDMDEYCNYMAVELYLGNTDWPQNNVKGWRPRMENGKFRFVLFDTDHAYSTTDAFNVFKNKQIYTFDQPYGMPSNIRKTEEIAFVTLFLNLLENETFRKKFIDTFCLIAGSVFEPSRCQQIATSIAERVYPTQSQYNWESPWNSANDAIRQLSESRQYTMIYNMKQFTPMNIRMATPRKINLSANIDEARILYNEMPVPANRFSGYAYLPVTISASAPAGYVFTGWRKSSNSYTALFPEDSEWKYYDKGSLDNTSWYSTSYNDNSWSSGAAPLGYANDGRTIGTFISYGDNANSKRPTYYFRKTFQLGYTPSASEELQLDMTIDDGCIVYVNGVEAFRYNMPSGSVSYNSFATTYANANPDKVIMNISGSLFRSGKNVIAVEVHNNSATSTDIEWAASLLSNSSGNADIVSTDPTYTLTEACNIIACFERQEAAGVPPVVINEVSAANDLYVNSYWKKNDWVELYNMTDQDIDLTGMYLTDNLAKPQKWQIPAATVPAHGYKIIWCDKLESTSSELHASFKLGNDEGGQVMLTAADGSWSDTLTYCVQTGNESVGRYPDGSRNVYHMTRTTLGRSNEMTSYCTRYDQPTVDGIDLLLRDDASSDAFAIYDLSGRLVASGNGPVRLTNLPSGIYIIKDGSRTNRVMVP